ncbi:tyrosine-type recombinase/integrase [Ureibacillus composti]
MVKSWLSENDEIPNESKEVLNEYLLSLKLANKAESTIVVYRSILGRFLSECNVSIQELTSEVVLKWFIKYSVGKKEKTIDLVFSTLSSFFKFCFVEEYIDTLIMKKRWRPKIPQSLPKYLTEQEYARVKLISEKLSLRDRALVLFIFSSGCRRSEVAQLTIQDVDLDLRTALVRGKGKKIRYIHFSIECALVLKDYLESRSYEPTSPLFLNHFGNALQAGGIYLIIKKIGEIAGLNNPLHPHCCRHTFATNMLARGAELEFVADELGHNNLNTTRIYARIPTESMRMAYQNIMG